MSYQNKAELGEDTTKLGTGMAQSKGYQGPQRLVFWIVKQCAEFGPERPSKTSHLEEGWYGQA